MLELEIELELALTCVEPPIEIGAVLVPILPELDSN